MENKEIKLSVKNLEISFRTDGGQVQAVRNIDFDLHTGETLAIVGESGSGKSVTSRAILGILANNAIKEGGEILYDGQDLMKISEEEFCKIRGDRISMIFQDPLSSLNPIMRIGKQMTEAMLINGKINQKNCRRDFNRTLSLLNKNMDMARGADNPEIRAQNKKLCADFDKFEYKHLELENEYNAAHEACVEAIDAIDDVLFHIEKHATTGLLPDVKEAIRLAERSVSRYVVHARAAELDTALDALEALIKVPFKLAVRNLVLPLVKRGAPVIDNTDYAAVATELGKVRAVLAEAADYDMPNFFAMGYCMTFLDEAFTALGAEAVSVAELNKYMRKRLDDEFMLEFIRVAEEGMKYSNARAVERKREAITVLDEHIRLFKERLEKKSSGAAVKALVAAVESAIDRLEIVKDNVAYTFRSSIKAAVRSYFDGIKRNAKEERRYARQKASFDKKVAAGKTPDWKVADKNLVELASIRDDVCGLIERVKARFEKNIAESETLDFDALAVGMIDYLKAKASGVAHKVTRGMAKSRALRLMEEVGIPEPRKRFRQYPFEFSGGMRQRIVIAIALSADPDVLICDEPTTALDVTIQSQILELINKVKQERQLSVIFITHDLGVVANMADRVAVMYAGKIVEIGTANDIFYSPAHPYTWALLSSMPDLDTKDVLEAIPGTPPNMIYPPKGDAFAERNKYAMQIDFEEQPPMFKISDTHFAATWLLHPNAPDVPPPKAVTDRIKRMREKANAARGAATDETAATQPESETNNTDETVGAAQAQAADTAPDAAAVAPKKTTRKTSSRAAVKKDGDGASASDKKTRAKASAASDKAQGGATARKSAAKPAAKSAGAKPATKSAGAKKPAAAKKPASAKPTDKKDGEA